MTGPDLVRDFFRQQSVACAKLGSPFMGRLLALLPDAIDPGSALAARLNDWPEGRITAQHDAL